MNCTVTQTRRAQAAGTYRPTLVDDRKAAADFRLINVAPNFIVWKDGRTQKVTERQLAKLQATHAWATDF